MRKGSGPGVVVPALVAAMAISASAHPQGDVKLISQGRQVAIEEHLAPGKLVIFDFFADWCAPCRQLTPRLERLASQYPDQIALRKVDVVNWESPVARQFQIGSLPYLALYGGNGEQLAAGDANRVLRVLGNHLEGGPAEVRKAARRSAVPAPVWLTLIAAMFVGSLVLRARGRRAVAASNGVKPAPAAPEGCSPRVWFALRQGGLDGPFSVEQLGTLHRSGELVAETRVRRRGESSWRRLDDVVGRI